MSRVGTVVTSAVLLALAGAGYFCWAVTQSGFSARAKPSRLETFLARRARGVATPVEAKRMMNPLSASPLNVAEARDHFADHCAICHANDGSGKTMINEGLYPPAPDLRAEDTRRLTDGELLYIIKNGIRFTGMPGWGGDDDGNWKLVLFIRHLPELTPRELDLMREINGLETRSGHEEGHHEY